MIRNPRHEILSLYRACLRASRRFNFPSSPGEASWSRVLATSARSEFDAHRRERDLPTILRLILTGRDALAQLEERARIAEERLAYAVDNAMSRGASAGGVHGGGGMRIVTADASPYALDGRAPDGEWAKGAEGGKAGTVAIAAVALAAETSDSAPPRTLRAQSVLVGEASRRAHEGLPQPAAGVAPADVRARAWTKLDPAETTK